VEDQVGASGEVVAEAKVEVEVQGEGERDKG
jgi:hypothetical protein